MPRIALLQLKTSDDTQANIGTAKKAIERAADGGAQIICTQELFATHNFCTHQSADPFKEAQEIPGPLSNELGQLAGDLGVVIVASMFELRTRGMYHNTAVVFDTDGSLLGKYRQQHIAQDHTTEQKYYFTQGDDGYQVFNTKFGKLGVLLSWDQWFPEASRINALMGADILIYPVSMGSQVGNHDEAEALQDKWQAVLKSHAITNGCFLAAINRVGVEAETEYWGKSFITDCQGAILAEATAVNDAIVYADVDLESIDAHRCQWPFFRDRRIDTYELIPERFVENPEE